MPPKKTEASAKDERNEPEAKPGAEGKKPRELSREELEALRRKLQAKFH